MGSCGRVPIAHWLHEPMGGVTVECGRGLSAPTESTVICQPGRGAEAPPTFKMVIPHCRFMGSLNLQLWTRIGAMNVARLSKVEEGRAVTAVSTLESRATCRFTGSSHLHSEAHRDHEPAAGNIAELANSAMFCCVSGSMVTPVRKRRTRRRRSPESERLARR